MTKVFKFGGASIKDIQSIKNVGKILSEYDSDSLVIIFSAMGKVTNMLEDVVESYTLQNNQSTTLLQKVKDFHSIILKDLFEDLDPIYNVTNNLFVEIEWLLEETPHHEYAYYYDQIVSIGEFLSTQIMSAYLHEIGFNNSWQDARDLIRTDNTYRNAKVDWNITIDLISNKIKEKHTVTQGFIGCTSENFTTTLGREGSDFTSAILAYCLDAKEVVIWKDVPGMMNADPKHFEDAQLFSEVSFDEAIELAFFGAKVIHPKTIQPLKKKGIPLIIRSFLNPLNEGTVIKDDILDSNIPSFIVKEDQLLISISDLNLAFIVETHMSQIFSILDQNQVGVNLMQNSAVSFSICVDNDKYKIPKLIEELTSYFEVLHDEGLRLFTLRHYTKESAEKFLSEKDVVLEQRFGETLQIVAR